MMFDPATLTWTCHVCKEERPDSKISVLSTQVEAAPRVVVTQNVRYCNDRPACIEGAGKVKFIGGKEHE